MQLAVLSLIVVAAVLTHGAHIDHTPDLTTKHFYVDTTHHVLVLKTPSGCYVHHLNRHENHDVTSPDALRQLESTLVDTITAQTSFNQHNSHFISHFSHRIRNGCLNMDIFSV